MMKPLLTAAACALSIATLLGSAPALAFETVEGLENPVTDAYYGAPYFIFQDSRLDSDKVMTRDNIPLPGFAYLRGFPPSATQPGIYTFQAYLGKDNPYVALDPLIKENQTYSSVLNNPFSKTSHSYYSRSEFDKEGRLIYDTFLYYDTDENGVPIYFSYMRNNPGSKEYERYLYENDNYWYTAGNRNLDPEPVEPFDWEELKPKTQFDLPTSGVGIFDFENSFVYYEGEVGGVSLAQILAGVDGELLSFHNHYDGAYADNDYASYSLSWFSDRKIIGMSLAYNLTAVPEPEAWVMLLAGLGIVGAVARRRRARAAM
ncbi:MAG: PEP-CTERM sorting domain-containing protein [Azoarcus sp.]|jgi:hypothetical protein|nr:PEP-CTERM sorting domain-containing protein [Azoarcus sp.]